MMRTLAILAGLLNPLPVLAQATTPPMAEIAEPSAEALELANLLRPQTFPGMNMPEEDDLRQTKTSFRTILVWRGPPCDLTNPQCDAVATEIAAKMVRDRRQYMEKLATYIYALHFQRTLSKADILDSIAFAKTKTGKSFLPSMLSVQKGQTFADAMNPYSGFFAKTPFPMWKDTSYREEFYNRTVNLPRQKLPTLAPPPRAPRPMEQK